MPVTFDEHHFCVALCTIHSSMLDFRFRSRELKPFSRAEYLKILEEEKKAQESNTASAGGNASKPEDKAKAKGIKSVSGQSDLKDAKNGGE